jgi:multiple sugar transport system ATP-binding protein
MGQVVARQLRKLFGDVPAVDGVDLEIRDGEFMVFLGPSGCGKTTILRMIAGLEQPTSGEIVIGDRVVNDLPPRTRGIAMVFQGYGLYSRATGSIPTSRCATTSPFRCARSEWPPRSSRRR